MARIYLLGIVSLFIACVAAGQTMPSTQPSAIVGTVYGKSITAGELGLSLPIDTATTFDARDTQRWEAMTRVLSAFGTPIAERFKQQHHIQAAAADIEAYNSAMLAARKRTIESYDAQVAAAKLKLQATDLSADERTVLERRASTLERAADTMRLAADRALSDTIASISIINGKTEAELHRIYGGRIIFQQAGYEALDARRRLFEDAEKAGDLTFADPGVRYLFYYYFNMRHPGGAREAIDGEWYFGSSSTKPATQPALP